MTKANEKMLKNIELLRELELSGVITIITDHKKKDKNRFLEIVGNRMDPLVYEFKAEDIRKKLAYSL